VKKEEEGDGRKGREEEDGRRREMTVASCVCGIHCMATSTHHYHHSSSSTTTTSTTNGQTLDLAISFSTGKTG